MRKNQIRFEYQDKPVICPVCQSKRIAEILWGMPAFSEQLMEDLDEGKVALGGCCVSEDDPVWRCADCRKDFYRKSS
ncbi:MAG TPA: hypothetical protein PKW57_08930 [Anaerolineaceae bacterium]|nr:hypothetical protein [Anaerolineaceae bacterium]